MSDTSPSHSEHPFISPLHFGMENSSNALLQKIARHAVELLDLKDCAVALVDDQRANLVLLAGSQGPVRAGQIALPLHTGLIAAVAERCEPSVLFNTSIDAHMQPLGEDEARALACLPLFDGEQLLGVLLASASAPEGVSALEVLSNAEVFSPEKLRLLSLLAEQATMALLNARQAELVRDADRMKANFLSLVTHELRSPLNAINGYLDLTLEGLAGELNEQQREFLQRARAGSEHLYALVEDLLLASRADAGQLRLNREPIVFRDLMDGALEELELTARDAQVSLEAEAPADLPTLLADPMRLQQVLRNLLCNALHFTPAGGRVTLSARVIEDDLQKKVEVRVTDTGCGIASEYHERIFERFFQVPRPEGGRASGQGLGLAIVKMIIELHGGHVWVESVPGEGSTFLITLAAL